MSFQNNIFFKKVKDYSVSKEIFELHHNPEYDLLITFPKPSLEKLPSYYESEDYMRLIEEQKILEEERSDLLEEKLSEEGIVQGSNFTIDEILTSIRQKMLDHN